MKNLWVQWEHPFATWVADGTALAAEPEALLELAKRILRAGEEHEVFVVERAPRIGYDRASGQDLGALLDEIYQHHRIVDLFKFTGTAGPSDHPDSSRVAAQLAWFERADRLVEGCV